MRKKHIHCQSSVIKQTESERGEEEEEEGVDEETSLGNMQIGV